MSVIGRMLRDLEARKAQPGAGGNGRTLKPGPDRVRRRKRRRGIDQRGIALALAIVLIVVAAVLWWQRAPELRAGLTQAMDRVGAQWDRWRGGASGEGAAENGENTAASAQTELEPEPARPPARLAAARFTGTGDEATLELRLEGDLRRDPGYSRQGAALSLRVPADAAGLDMPAPPADQRVFKSVTLQSNGGPDATIRLQVAQGARFDLTASAGSLTLSGRLSEAATAPEPAASESQQASAATGSDAATAAAPAEAADREAAAERTASEPAQAASDSADANAQAPAAAPPKQAADASRGAAAGASDEGAATESARGGSGAMEKEDRSSPAVRAERRYREARSAVSVGDLGQARQRLREALDLDPGLHRARDLLAALHRRAGQGDAARDVLAEGVERAPARVAYAKPYARLLVDAGDLEHAARVLADAAGAAGNDAEFHGLTAAVAQRRGRHEAAASAYTRALELEAGNGRWWLGLGVSLAASGHSGEAAAAFREARRTGSLTPRLDAWVRGRIQALEGDAG